MKPATIILFLSFCLFSNAQDTLQPPDKLQRHFYRAELTTGPLLIGAGAISTAFAVTQKNFVSSHGIGGLTGIVLGSIVLSFGLDDRKTYKQTHTK